MEAAALRGAGAFLRILSKESLLLALNSGCLNSQACAHISNRVQPCRGQQHTPTPYPTGPSPSLFCLTLWKSYLFNWRTKLAKLECLKCLGRMDFVNFSFCQQPLDPSHKQHEIVEGIPRVLRSYHHSLPIVLSIRNLDPPTF